MDEEENSEEALRKEGAIEKPQKKFMRKNMFVSRIKDERKQWRIMKKGNGSRNERQVVKREKLETAKSEHCDTSFKSHINCGKLL